ncbi:hypothetical protein JJB11_03600 [Ramlibacter ginsenosidimutans]|uniref:Uncharacterized protein n=1 Tax=Ramlibacter ginsenosidimutans TaxID=502333 RepID=A0A934WL38_9BURK|nr:hypothetical protein [Ramlibacter ginsenosidimutans]MBK6005166.1 hypothetical protein [Ramlibacter ginsenosidimutans]
MISFVLSLGLALSGCGGGGTSSSAVAAGQKQTAAVGGSPSTSTTTSPSTSVARANLVPLGVNIEGLADYARLQPFVDMMKTARVWGSAAAPWDGAVATDAQGWPTTDAGIVVSMVTQDAGDDQTTYKYLTPGTYKLRFTGTASVASVGSPGTAVANYVYDRATNRSAADVVIGSNATQLMLTFTGTSGGVRDVSLRRPGYPENQTFTNEFIQALAPFGVVRLMDFLATNGNPVQTWGERTTPASGNQTGPKGAAYEYAIAMANELGKDIWITIPFGADDGFVRQLATLLNTNLAPGRVVYVEYSNELWNFFFSQAGQNTDAAVTEALAGDTTLTGGTQCTQALFDLSSGTCNKWWAGFFRVGKRVVRIAQIFSEVMGSAALNNRVRVVYATQFANPNIAEQVLKNIATYRAKPSSVIYGVATAPYFQLPDALASATDATKDQILGALQTALMTDIEPSFALGTYDHGVIVKGKPYSGIDYSGATHKALADYYGIKSLSYEGGPDLRQYSENAATKIAANRDAQMGAMLKSELSQWYGCGNDLYMHYSLVSGWAGSGYWGLSNNPTDLSGAKYTAVQDIANSVRSAFTTCQ